MKEITLLIIVTVLVFVGLILTLIFGIVRNNWPLKIASIFAGVFFLFMVCWTSYKVGTKTFSKIAELRLRTGDQLYDSLFGRRQTHCVKVLNFQGQMHYRPDYALWLHFETCPEELQRILSRHEYSVEKLATKYWDGEVPYGRNRRWFDPKSLGDTIMVYEYSSDDSRNVQTIWVSQDSTRAFCRDIRD